ncbi:hypothetical protein [Nocardia thailandica]
MAPTSTLNEATLAGIRTDFEAKAKELKTLPDKVKRGYEYLLPVSTVLYIAKKDDRDKIIDILEQIDAKIMEAVEGMFAPWLFLDYSAKWQAVGSSVRSVLSIANDELYNLEGNWDGSAYKSYKESKDYQTNAMNGVVDLCEKMKDQLLAIAEEGRNLYTTLINKLVSVIGAVATFYSEASASLGTSVPLTLPTLNDAVVSAAEFVGEAITGFVEVQSKVWIASNELTTMIQSPAGMSKSASGADCWPSPNTKEYDNKDDDWKLDGED